MSTTPPWAKVGSYCTYSKASLHNWVNQHLLYYFHAGLWLSVPLQAGGEKKSLTEETHHPLQQLQLVSVPRPHAVLLGVCAHAQCGRDLSHCHPWVRWMRTPTRRGLWTPGCRGGLPRKLQEHLAWPPGKLGPFLSFLHELCLIRLFYSFVKKGTVS
jgi:hypothetical protein